jgi:hypothetical protein
MRFVTPSMIWPFEHTQERFVEQGCRLQGMPKALAPEIFRGQAAKLFVRCSGQFTGISATASVCVAMRTYYVFDRYGLAYHMPKRM